MDDPSSRSLSVLVAVEDATERDRVRGWIAGTDGFEPWVAGATEEPFDGDVDVCVFDVPGIRAHHDALAAARESTAVHLPSLLVVTEGDEVPERVLDRLDAGAELIDDTIAEPVRAAGFERRLRSLGRVRRYSTESESSRNRLQRLARHLPDGMFVCRDGVVRYSNPVAESLLGAEHDESIGRAFADLVPLADRDRVTAVLAEAQETGQGGPEETLLTREAIGDNGDRPDRAAGTHDVERPPVPVAVTAIAAGDETQVIARDLRERREREERLTLYRRAMDEATVGITIADHTDDEEALTYVNNEFKRLTGLTDEELLGRNPRFLQTDATDVESVARLRRAIDDGEEASVVLLNRRADGRKWYNALDVFPIRDDDGEVTHYLGFQRDVTERVTRDQRLTVLDRVLRHNIRNRLNVVLGYTDHIEDVLVAATTGDDGDGGDGAGSDGADSVDGCLGTDGVDVDALRTDAEHVRVAAADVLALSDSARRFREDVVDADEASPVDACTVVREVAGHIADSAAAAEIRISVPDERVCVAGAAPLSLVTEELLTNTVEHVESPDVSVSLTVEDNEAILTVEDDGPGITPDSRTPLGLGSETPTEHGQGVGLWLVRWSVDAAGGTVAYEDAPDGGACVVARFPTVADEGDDGPDGGGSTASENGAADRRTDGE